MFNFFIEKPATQDEKYQITDKDYNHIKNVLRMRIGDKLYVSSNGKSDLCEICEFNENCAVVKIIEENALDSSLPINITLFQGLPKSDKLELIIQKAVELGVNAIVPVEMKNCVVKIEEKKKENKRERWQSICESAAKQSKRNFIPKVFAPLSFKRVLEQVKNLDMLIVPYENEKGMVGTKNALSMIKKGMNVGVFVGPEGGFDSEEIALLTGENVKLISLGKRILRTETASITALSALMLHAEMNV